MVGSRHALHAYRRFASRSGAEARVAVSCRMNSTLYRHNGSHTTFTAVELHAPEFHDALAIKRKALERWENEGGRIPELSLRRQRNELRRPKTPRMFVNT